MILDEQGLFSNKQKITQDCTSENILALGKREVSFGTPVEIFVQIAETFNNLTSLSIKVQTSMTEDFATSTDLIEQTIALANLTKGAVLEASEKKGVCRMNLDAEIIRPRFLRRAFEERD